MGRASPTPAAFGDPFDQEQYRERRRIRAELSEFAMTTHREEPSARAMGAAVHAVIVDTLERDSARRALEEVVERCMIEARCPVDEIDKAGCSTPRAWHSPQSKLNA